MMASTSTGADAVALDGAATTGGAAGVTGAALAAFVTGAECVTGAALGAAVAPVLARVADGSLPMAALLASVTLSQSFPKMLTHRLAVLE
jgi:hypothetical protein